MTRNKNFILLTLVVVVSKSRKIWNIKKKNFCDTHRLQCTWLFNSISSKLHAKSWVAMSLLFKNFWNTPVPFERPLRFLFWASSNVFYWFQSQGECPHLCASLPVCNRILSQIHLWCETCWPPSSKHGSWAILIHILVNNHWVGWRPGSIALLPHSENRQTLYQLSYAGSTYISINGTHFPPDLIDSKCQSDLLTLIAMLSNGIL